MFSLGFLLPVAWRDLCDKDEKWFRASGSDLIPNGVISNAAVTQLRHNKKLDSSLAGAPLSTSVCFIYWVVKCQTHRSTEEILESINQSSKRA